MIKGTKILLRSVQESDWAVIETWGKSRESLWGEFQRFQLDHLPLLQASFEKTRLLSRESGFLLIETLAEPQVIGYVRYTLIPYPDSESLPAVTQNGKRFSCLALSPNY